MQNFTTRPEIKGTFGVVATTHWLATAAGMGILERGGNAFDAAVATGFALQVVEPHLNGPGGDVPIIIHDAKTGVQEVICGQGVTPAGASIEAYKALGLDVIPGTGPLAAVVPGSFDAWLRLLIEKGTMTLAQVLEPAIGFAERGYPLVPNISNTIATVKELFEEEWTTSAEIYLKNGNVPQAGTLFKNEALAATYKKLIAEGDAAGGSRETKIQAARDAWYKGFVAEAIDRYVRNTPTFDTSGERHVGFLTADDMAGWQATVEAPLTLDYQNYTVLKTGPWGQGPVFLQQLALLKGFDLDKMPYDAPEFVHLVVECAKLAYADREAFYGDPDFIDVPMDTLLSEAYNAERRKLVDLDKASLELRPGVIPGYGAAPVVREQGSAGADATGAGEPTVARFENLNKDAMGQAMGRQAVGDTCHIDIIDQDGNMVSATPSGGWLQSNPVIPELGFCLTTRAQMFWLDEGLPSSLAPKRRPRTTLSPCMALRDGEAYMAFGTPGGDKQDQWALSFFLRHVHHGLNLQEAIDAPSFHSDHFPASFFPREWNPGHLAVEGRMPEKTQDALRAKGHNLEVDEDWSIGRLSAASKEPDGMLKAAANPRFMQGYATGR